LAPHTAHELIFLQDAFPALRRFEESKLGWWCHYKGGFCRLMTALG
jgi:hypothetical protein